MSCAICQRDYLRLLFTVVLDALTFPRGPFTVVVFLETELPLGPVTVVFDLVTRSCQQP